MHIAELRICSMNFMYWLFIGINCYVHTYVAY